MRSFDIPKMFQSPVIRAVKQFRKLSDPRKKDFTPTTVDFGPIVFHLSRHFGFCYGVENAIEIAYKALFENEGKRIFLLSEMIHNPEVNEDLKGQGVQFLMNTSGKVMIPFTELSSEDIVIVPAFGTTLEIQEELNRLGINPYKYDTTCPFVEKVWNRSAEIAAKDFTTVIHGKPSHEETRATFSHASAKGHAIILKDIEQARLLASYLKKEKDLQYFHHDFNAQLSEGFDPLKHLQKIGVVNQTTMLATETQEIADFLRQTLIEVHGIANIKEHFADTRDTLCYATNENQTSVLELVKTPSSFAVVAGGYNSSNTSHLVELCEAALPTYFIRNHTCLSAHEIKHFDLRTKTEKITRDYIPSQPICHISLLSGASCPDIVLEGIIHKIITFFPDAYPIEEAMRKLVHG